MPPLAIASPTVPALPSLPPDARQRLEALLRAIGPSGHERAAARVWREHARAVTAAVRSDFAGNSVAEVGPDQGPVVLLAGHIDEIGLVVRHIDERGFVYVAPIGGWDPTVLVGQRIRFLGSAGGTEQDVVGVVGRRATHLMTDAEQDEPIRLKGLWVDIGSSSRADTETVLRIGDAGVIDVAPIALRGDLLASRALDNRIGAFIVLEALRRYAAAPGAARVVATANTQEEVARLGGGALVAATRENPDVAIVVDLTFAVDHPGLESAAVGDRPLGSGPVLCRGGAVSPVVVEMLEASARMHPPVGYTLEAVGGPSGTDLDAITLARRGVPTGLVSVPCRYMHSPNEIVHLADVERAIDVLVRFCQSVRGDTQYIVR